MVTPSRTEQRKARTRAALVAAAQDLMSEGRVEVSIHEITDRADVGFGSFYNHFTDKEELWAAALGQTLAAYGALVSAVTADVTDPAEEFCIGLRLVGRIRPVYPKLKVLLHTGIADLLSVEGFTTIPLASLETAIEADRFDVADAELALAIGTGAVLGLLHMIDSRPDVDPAALTDEVAMRVLLALGLRRAEAKRLVNRALPELPTDLSPFTRMASIDASVSSPTSS